jgi:hypothetical protein
VLGADKTVDQWEFLVQYLGRFVADYEELAQPAVTDPTDPLAQMAYTAGMLAMEMENFNRLFVGNADRMSHSVSARAGLNLLYETLHIELAGMYNFTTEDYAVIPEISYDITDAFTVSTGGRHLNGPDNSLNNLVSNLMSFAYLEMKLLF